MAGPSSRVRKAEVSVQIILVFNVAQKMAEHVFHAPVSMVSKYVTTATNTVDSLISTSIISNNRFSKRKSGPCLNLEL